METLKLKGNWNELKGKLKKSYAEPIPINLY